MHTQENHPKPQQRQERNSESLEEPLEIQQRRQEVLADQEEKSHHDKEQVSHEEALEKASRLAEQSDTSKKKDDSESPERRILRGAPSKKQLGQSFNNQMNNVRQELPLPQRAFSRLIHAKPIEVTAEFLEKTVARPNALLSGSIAAFLAVSTSYFVARYFGFQLSGFETIGAFILGWIIGIIYDYLTTLFSKSR